MNRVRKLELLSWIDDETTKNILSEVCEEIDLKWLNMTSKMDFLEAVLENHINVVIFHIKVDIEMSLEMMKTLKEDSLSREIPIIIISDIADNDGLALATAAYPVIAILNYKNWRYQVESQLKVLVDTKRYQQDLYTDMVTVKETNYTDPLTGALNRRGCERGFEHLVGYHASNGEAFSLIILDIDHFKKVNDTYGHDIGDEILVEMASNIKNQIRGCDYLIRFGGEEFILLLCECGLESAKQKAEEIRQQIEMTPLSKKNISITASFGLLEYSQEMTLDNMIKEADRCLYKAKEEGRNRVVSSLRQ